MTNPTIAAISPEKVTLEAGKNYFFCACGHSGNQPFCDGSHAGTHFTPIKFHSETTKDAWLCRCKHSDNQLYCDGSHKQFTEADIGQEGPGS